MKRFLNIFQRSVVCLLLVLFVSTGLSANSYVWAKKPAKKAVRYPAKLVLRAQRALAKKGYKTGGADGIWGSMTASAVRRFQKQKNITVTGKLDYKTMRALFK